MNRVALITGGTRGIGLGIAESLADEGYDLALCGLRPEEVVHDTLTALRERGAGVLYYVCDVADPEARKALLDGVESDFGRLHVLVNNAGVAPKERKDLLEASEESFEWVMKTNLQGPYFLTQAVAQWMLQQREADSSYRASIINISSISATLASINRGEYCLSKAGLSMATQLWATRLAAHGIGVYEVRPGVTTTDMTTEVKDKYDALIADGLVPQGRWGEPSDTGKAVAALARDDFPYSTGQVILTDGGMTIPRL